MATALQAVSLDDKYARMDGQVHISGTQALVRMAMLQAMRDRAAGLNTAGYISGYRGSPMHNVDKELWRIGNVLGDNAIHFWPAINEDLAATAIWGTQQIAGFGDATVDGVFAMWYGKGPGLDRSMDAIRHGHTAGSGKNGGVLVVVGDDHALTSTDVPAAHEYTFVDLMMPLLYPANVQEIIEYGLYGYALSRYCGAWVGFKAIPDTIDAATSLLVSSVPMPILLPSQAEFQLPADGLNLRIPDLWHQQEPRHRRYKLDAALAFARCNNLNRCMINSPQPRYGIVATGKAYNDTRQALRELGLTDKRAADLGIVVYKLAMPYPFDDSAARDFADGLDEVLVVEEKHTLTETHYRDALYRLPDGRRPRIVGQRDENGAPLLPLLPEYRAEDISRVLAARLAYFYKSEQIDRHLAMLDAQAKRKTARRALSIVRQPYFCSGCPHSSSTKVPDGSRAHGGVGCHFMSTYMDRDNITHSHMGGEGLTFVGQSAFVKTNHVFQNIGDGTYYHSGTLAIRACVAAKVNITFKILFNDAVAMTGGQPVDGEITPAIITRQLAAEGVATIYLVSDQPQKYTSADNYAAGTLIRHRDELDQVQRECREIVGVSALVYDQTCAAEKRRRRKSGRMEDPAKRVFINDRVCEGCGDCGTKSNCMSVTPLNTPFGRKRAIDQSACNKDYSCVKGFCPSFVSVLGGLAKKSAMNITVPAHLRMLPEPERPSLENGQVYSILITGVGGTGVVTIGALITMAVHMEGRHFASVDQFGMAQKGGAVTSHLRLAANSTDIHAVRLNAGSANLVIGCDSLVTGSDIALDTMAVDSTQVIQNTHQQITGHFNRDPKMQFPVRELDTRLAAAVRPENIHAFDASAIATRLLGDSIASNLFILGYAYQQGLLPVSAAAIEAAIKLNGVAVEMNNNAFLWGRRAARDMPAVQTLAHDPAQHKIQPAGDSADLAAQIELFSQELTAWQNAAWAGRFNEVISKVAQCESAIAAPDGGQVLTHTVARNLFKLMAYKDEYEVARLYTDGRFEANLKEKFSGDYRLKFHLAPPLFARRDTISGELQKQEYGSWVLVAMRLLAKLKPLRGTVLDVFGYSAERQRERLLISQYIALVEQLCADLSEQNLPQAIAIAALADDIRGYGHIKETSIAEYQQASSALLACWPSADRQPRRRTA